jgi:hypothetical protein
VNDAAEMASLIALGVDGMFTNFLDRLTAVLGDEIARGKQGGKRAADANAACRAGG